MEFEKEHWKCKFDGIITQPSELEEFLLDLFWKHVDVKIDRANALVGIVKKFDKRCAKKLKKHLTLKSEQIKYIQKHIKSVQKLAFDLEAFSEVLTRNLMRR